VIKLCTTYTHRVSIYKKTIGHKLKSSHLIKVSKPFKNFVKVQIINSIEAIRLVIPHGFNSICVRPHRILPFNYLDVVLGWWWRLAPPAQSVEDEHQQEDGNDGDGHVDPPVFVQVQPQHVVGSEDLSAPFLDFPRTEPELVAVVDGRFLVLNVCEG